MLYYTVVVTAPQLWQPSHTSSHRELADLVLRLRDRFGWTFSQIAEQLNSSGLLSPRGKSFYGALVHSMYFKWSLRQRRYAKAVTLDLKEVCLMEAPGDP